MANFATTGSYRKALRAPYKFGKSLLQVVFSKFPTKTRAYLRKRGEMPLSIILKLMFYSLHRSMWNEANIQKTAGCKVAKKSPVRVWPFYRTGRFSIHFGSGWPKTSRGCLLLHKRWRARLGRTGVFFQALQVAIVVILHLSSLFQPVICISPQIVFHFAEMAGLLLTWLWFLSVLL